MNKEINLLPMPDQAERMRRIYFYRVGQIIRRLDLILVIILLAMGIIYAGIVSSNAIASKKVAISEPKGPDYTKQLTDANELFRAVSDRTLKYWPWTASVVEILRVLPPTLSLTSLSVDESTQTLQIQGLATNKEDIATMEKALQALPSVGTLTSPLSNFATGPNQGFIFKVTRKVGPI